MKKITTNLHFSFWNILLFLVWLIPFVITLRNIVSGSIPFWYDPARDLLLALDNLQKFTLIGPPSGIPGIFYGPYWIWAISISLLFSKDPRFVSFLVLAVPYFTIFPYVLLKFSSMFGKQTVLLLWLLFIFAFNYYATYIWNPSLFPLLFLVVIYLLVTTSFKKKGTQTYIKIFFAGIILGIAFNLHISLGLGTLIGSFLFLIIDLVKDIYIDRKVDIKTLIVNRILIVGFYLLGLFIAFIPFLIFEYRHGFLQIQTVIKTLTSPTSVVSVVGLSKIQIIQNFFERPHLLLAIPLSLIFVLFIVSTGIILLNFKKNKALFNIVEIKLILLLLLISIAILFIYLTSKNPVWDYHFIGVEIIFLLFTALIVSRIFFLRNVLMIWVGIIVVMQLGSFVKAFSADPYNIPSLATKEHIVNIIKNDAYQKPFSVFVYNPAIYTFDYDYLFKWKLNKDVNRNAEEISSNVNFVYLIIPESPKLIQEDFINYKTKNTSYKTVEYWRIADGTTIIKRAKQ